MGQLRNSDSDIFGGEGEELLYLHKISREKFVFCEKHDDISRRDDSW